MKQIIRAGNSSRILSNTCYHQSRIISQATNDYKRNDNSGNNQNTFNYTKHIVGIGVAATILVGYEFIGTNIFMVKFMGTTLKMCLKTKRRRQNVSLQAEVEAGSFKASLPSYSMDEVAKHNTKENKIWVTFKRGVYDITNFVADHPGGDQIMMAAGSATDPFWLLYGVHKTPSVMALLESMRIGNLSEEDATQSTVNMLDPYGEDPVRHPILKPASRKPFNAEPPPGILVENFLTPNEFFYVRNHLPVPTVDIATYELEIEVEGKNKTKTLSFADIKKLPKHQVTATIMCAGNRRSEMTKVKPVKGLDWGPAATGNATWAGASLRDVLELIGINEDSEGFSHVHFQGLDTDTTNTAYEASIPFTKALDKRGDVILAYEMNSEPLPRDHGFPIRLVAPGIVGARNVKWLGRIFVSTKESTSHWQHGDYKGFSPSIDWDTVDWDKSPAIQELPVISAICRPSEGSTVKVENGYIMIQGYAWSGGGKQIIRVDVTADQGNTWHVANADFQDANLPPRHWAWTLWSAKIPVKTGTKQVEIWAKAVDSAYNTQPEDFKNIWNLRGVLNNAYHRVKVNLKW